MAERKKRLTTLAVWIVLAGGLFWLFASRNPGKPDRFEGADAFRADVAAGRVAEVRVNNNEVIVALRNGERYYTLCAVDDDLTKQLSEQAVPIRSGEESGAWNYGIIALVSAVVFFLMLAYFRNRSGGVTNILTLRNTKARLIPEMSKVSFADVGGCEEAKQSLGDVVDFLKDSRRWATAGVRLPRGILLEGPPGCGKTLLARAVAGETKAKFYLVSASEFVEMFVGVGAARVRDTCELARKNAPAVIFIDELDAVGRRRGSGIGSSHDEREQTLNQLLVCMDGFESREPVVVISATNRPDILDPALVRPGRFDRRIRIPELSCAARLEALRIHCKNKKLAADVALEVLAGRADGFNGAQLENLANEAALLALRRARDADGRPAELRMDDFLQALLPPAARSRVFNKLDAVLIESTTQLAEPTGRARVRVVLDGNAAVEGELVWADANFLKIRGENAQMIVPKAQVRRIEALEGTEAADPLDVIPDPWARRSSGLA